MRRGGFFATRAERYSAAGLGLAFVVLAVLDIIGAIGG
jgi:hypothetical protein